MKNYFTLIGLVIVLNVTFSCKDKNDKGAISPDYSSTGNPYPNNQTVTGSTTFTSPATQNTSFIVGDIGWSNPSCISTSSTGLRAQKNNIDVILSFASAATNGTYAISSNVGAGSCVLTAYNVPDQPAGVYWYGKGGSVIITTNATSISAKLVNVVCTQKEFNFPQVLISGAIGCSQ
ncbi:hypothetical protein [Aurantibacillus circumpalustris]|uniref:hypothetical protein n=1 Tax=Aurantibacillus circumpalustris TaxID=3036359 RepID=UPI00295C1509|nr:hypothetical protein [Aurantibacillus circumpalustris]